MKVWSRSAIALGVVMMAVLCPVVGGPVVRGQEPTGPKGEQLMAENEARRHIDEAMRKRASDLAGNMPPLDSSDYSGPPQELVVLGGSEIAAILGDSAEDLKKWGINIDFVLTGSPDVARTLASPTLRARYDVFIPGSSNWLEAGFSAGTIAQKTPVARCPVVLAIASRELSKRGWDPKDPPTILQIAQAVAKGDLKIHQTSVSQSMSGLGWAIALLTSEAQGKPLSVDFFQETANIPNTIGYFANVDNSSSSTGYLATNAFRDAKAQPAWINYEFHGIAVNAALQAAGREPYAFVYPSDGVYVGDVTLAVRAEASPEKLAAYNRLCAYLTSPRGQHRVVALGRRPIQDGVPLPGFPEYTAATHPLPSLAVVDTMLERYARSWRRPALSVFVVGYGDLMKGEHLAQLRSAWTTLFGSESGVENLTQGEHDITVVIPYSTGVQSENIVTLVGNAPQDREAFLAKLLALEPGGATYTFSAVREAISKVAAIDADHKEKLPERFKRRGYNVAVMLFTDDIAADTPSALSASVDVGYPLHTTGIGRARASDLILLATYLHGRSVDANRGVTRALIDLSGMNK